MIAVAVVLLVGLAGQASAAINKQVNFQGRLTDPSGFGVANGTYNVEFKLHNHATNVGGAQGVCDGSCLWMETRAATKVTVTRGLFAVQLGEITSLAGVNFDLDPVYLSIRVGGTGALPTWDAEMTPRQRLGASPQAFFADNAGMLGGQLPSYYTTAGNLTGTLADARLSSNVALRNINNNFTTSQTITGQLTLPTAGSTGGLILGGDTNLYRLAADNLATDDTFHSRRLAAADTTFITTVEGEAASRWKIRTDGKMTWGDGTGLHDTNLYRGGVDQLNTDDDLMMTVRDLGGVKFGTQGRIGVDNTNQLTIRSGTGGFRIMDNAQTTQLVNVTDAGDVGFGAGAAPSQDLAIIKAGQDAGIKVQSTDTTKQAYVIASVNGKSNIYMGINNATNQGVIGVNALASDAALPGSSDVISIQPSTGNVGIGRSATAAKLDVNGTVRIGKSDVQNIFLSAVPAASWSNIFTTTDYNAGLYQVAVRANANAPDSRTYLLLYSGNFYGNQVTVLGNASGNGGITASFQGTGSAGGPWNLQINPSALADVSVVRIDSGLFS